MFRRVRSMLRRLRLAWRRRRRRLLVLVLRRLLLGSWWSSVPAVLSGCFPSICLQLPAQHVVFIHERVAASL